MDVLAIDLLEEEWNIVVIKRESPTEHHIENDTTAPYVDLWSCIQFS